MEKDIATLLLVWSVKVLSFAILMLTIYATVNIFQSIWFRFWLSRRMDERERLSFYVNKRYDVKSSFCMMVMCLLSSVLMRLIGLKDLSWWNLLCFFLFWILFWGNSRTLNIEKERLKRKNDFGI